MKRQTKKFLLFSLSLIFMALIATSCYQSDDSEILNIQEQTEDQTTDEQNGNTKKPKG